jgi:hypothetical protein
MKMEKGKITFGIMLSLITSAILIENTTVELILLGIAFLFGYITHKTL